MRYVVVGASAAGISAVKTIRELDKKAEIIVVSKDTAIYSRCIMHHYMEGIRDMEKLCFVNPNFMNNNRVTWKKGLSLVKVNEKENTITLSDGQVIAYDKLLLATGSSSFFPPIEGLRTAKNAIGFRNFEDCLEIMKAVKTAKNIVVMGAGLVAIDAITGLLEYDVNLSVVEMKDRMLSMQLDKRAASVYETEYEKRGVKQYYNSGISSLDCREDGTIEAVHLPDGTILPCDLLIVAAGVRANVAYLEDSEVETDRFGLLIDETGKTNVENIYGAGDVTGRNPIWSVAVKEGVIAASNMCGVETKMDDFFGAKSTMNFLGIPTMSLGINEALDETYQVEIQDDGVNYKKVIHKDGVIYGALIQGDLSYTGVLTQMIRLAINVEELKKPLFAIDYSDFFHMTEEMQFTYNK